MAHLWSRLRRPTHLILGASMVVGGLVTVQAAPAAAASCSPLRQCIYSTADGELHNASRNREGTANCNFYSGWWGNSGSASSSCPTTSGVKWRQNSWCADFARFIWYVNGAVTTGLDPWAGSFYRSTVGTSRWKPKSSGYVPRQGDVVVYDFQGGDPAADNGWGIDHVGIVVSYNAASTTSWLTTIEGNADPDSGTATQGIYLRHRTNNELNTAVIGYVVPIATSGPVYG